MKELYRRIQYAAAQVCPAVSYRDLDAHAHVRHCREQAVARALQQIDNPQLLAVHFMRAKNG